MDGALPGDPVVWVAALYAIGFSLLVLEIFIPGWVAGTAGVLAVAASVYVAWTRLSPVLGAALAVGGAVGMPAILVWGMKRMALKPRLSAEEGYVAGGGRDLSSCVGAGGLAATPLRPSGAVEIGGRRYDARAEAGFLERGTAVVVVRAQGSELVVRKAGNP